jgi:hypothetical protein
MIHRGDPFQGFAAAASGRNSKIMFDQFPNHGPNAITPDLMTPAERFREIGEILVAGLLRLKAHESIRSGSNRRDISLDFTANQSGHGRTKK